MLSIALRIIGSGPVLCITLLYGTTLHPVVAVPCAMGFYLFLMVALFYHPTRPLPDK